MRGTHPPPPPTLPAQNVLLYLDARSHDAHAELTFEEYLVILEALSEGVSALPLPPPEGTAGDVGAPASFVPPALPPTAAVVAENLARDKQVR